MNSLISPFSLNSPRCRLQFDFTKTKTRVKLLKKGYLKKENQTKSKDYSILPSFNESYKVELISPLMLNCPLLYMNIELIAEEFIIPLYPLQT